MKKILILCLAIAAIFLGGCENGLENPHDTPQQSYIGAIPIADTEFEQFPQATPQIEHTEEHENAAVTMTIQDISPSGLSFFFANNSDREFIYFPRYALYIRQNNAWQPVEPIIDGALFPDIVFGILPHSTTEMRTVDWQWWLGELSDGEYKFQKEIVFSHSPGDFDVYVMERRFSLLDNVAIVLADVPAIPRSFPISIPIDSLVTMTIQDITPSGLSFFFENNTYKEFIYGLAYSLYIRRDNAWQPVEPIIDNWAFPSIGFGISPHSTTEIRLVDWYWLFGELSDGEYKFQKEIIFLRSPGDFDVYVMERRFSLFDNVAIVLADVPFPNQPSWWSFPSVQGNMQRNSVSVTMTLQDISPSGLSFFFENNSGRAYTHSPVYTLYVRRDNAWQPVEPINDISDFIPDISYSIFPHSTTEITAIGWEWWLGELPNGEYKIQKEIRHWRYVDDFDVYVVEQYFSLPQQDVSMDYADFLGLLAASGFSVEEGREFRGGTMESPLSTVQRFVYVDGERLRVEIYDSNEIMERAAPLIGITSVSSPDFPYTPLFQITWSPGVSPRWFKRDLLIVFYGGNDRRVLDFLVENFEFFVGFDLEK